MSEGTQFKCVDTLLKEIGNKHSEDELIQVCKELGCDIFLFKTIKYVSFGELNIENFIELKKRERINNIIYKGEILDEKRKEKLIKRL